MKIEELKKKTKVQIIEEYMKQFKEEAVASGKMLEAKVVNNKLKEKLEEVKKGKEKLDRELMDRVNSAVEAATDDLAEELVEVKKNYKKLNIEHNKLKQHNAELKTLVNDLEAELESKAIPTEPEDGDLDGVPWSQLPEDKLVEVVRSQGAMLNKQARKLKKYKKSKK